MMVAPLLGWRQVEVTERKTRVDYARMLKDLSDVHFPEAETIIQVQDNLTTHDPASRYEALERAVRCAPDVEKYPRCRLWLRVLVPKAQKLGGSRHKPN